MRIAFAYSELAFDGHPATAEPTAIVKPAAELQDVICKEVSHNHATKPQG